MTGYLLDYGTDTLLHQMKLIDTNVPVLLEQPGEQYDTQNELTPKLLATHAYRRVEQIRLTEVDGDPHLLLRLKKPEPVEKNPGVGMGCGCTP